MEVQIFNEVSELGRVAGSRILSTIEELSEPVVGLATGSSPVSLYQGWGELVRERNLDVTRVRGFALDEYCGLPRRHAESYHSVIHRDAVEVIGLNPQLVHVPIGIGKISLNAAHYEQAIREAGGIDVQILGIGRNGHLGFNEPGSPFDSRTRKVELSPETIADNARFFSKIENVPVRAITQGLGTILEAREIVVIAIGDAKAPAVAAAINGPLTTALPASVLRQHANVTWYLDTAAASLL